MRKLWYVLLGMMLLTGYVGAQGKEAPDFTLRTLDGKVIRLSDYRGKVVVLNFWASWCPPCRRELPEFAAFAREQKDSGVVVIGIAIDESIPAIRKLITENNISYPVVLGDRKVQDDYGGIRGVPTTFIIDRNRVIVKTHVGMMSKSDLEAAVRAVK